ncbi:MAG: hypothetical protein EBS31_04350 [Burkholderiaceae bacterium]|nr:hypothetical protein [Burkholderiaceae bacterium]
MSRLALQRQLHWHRTEQLSEIITTLEFAKDKLRHQFLRSDFEFLTQRIRIHLLSVAEYSNADTAKLLSQISDEQHKNLEKNIAKSNAKFRKEFIGETKDKQLKLKTERVIDRSKSLFGKLSSEQERKIAEIVKATYLPQEQLYEDRLRRQKEFLDIVQFARNNSSKQADILNRLNDFYTHFELGRHSQSRAIQQARLKANIDMSLNIVQIMETSQRQHAIEKLDSWIKDLEDLRSQASVTAAK